MSTTGIQHFHLGACPCCGSDTACTRGFVEQNGIRVASYLVKWTVGQPAHGMGWLVSLATEEVAVVLGYSFEHQSFMVRNRDDYEWSAVDLSGFSNLLDRDQVIGTPWAKQVFGIVDEIWLHDPYIRQFVESAGHD